MITRLFRLLTERFPSIRTGLWAMLYDRFARRIRVPEWRFMNYGYAWPANSAAPQLRTEDEPDRLGFQLYAQLLNRIEINSGMRLLEVGCGRGGGAYLMKQYYTFEQVTGLDLSVPAIEFCRSQYRVDGLHYVQGNALDLPFPEQHFDLVINVESCHAYASLPAFIAEVKRVLKPGGYLLLTDSRLAPDIRQFRNEVSNSGLSLVAETDITTQVVASLEADSARREQLIRQHIPFWFRPYFREFAGTAGTKTLYNFKSRNRIYLSFVLLKS
jgi:ubiquinone/menaquinone biosynthesis C-methylase UbiE